MLNALKHCFRRSWVHCKLAAAARTLLCVLIHIVCIGNCTVSFASCRDACVVKNRKMGKRVKINTVYVVVERQTLHVTWLSLFSLLFRYLIDTANCKQTNESTGFVREVRCLPSHAAPAPVQYKWQFQNDQSQLHILLV